MDVCLGFCPSTFAYDVASQTCLYLITTLQSWVNADAECHSLGYPGAHLAVIDDSVKQTAATNYIAGHSLGSELSLY